MWSDAPLPLEAIYGTLRSVTVIVQAQYLYYFSSNRFFTQYVFKLPSEHLSLEEVWEDSYVVEQMALRCDGIVVGGLAQRFIPLPKYRLCLFSRRLVRLQGAPSSTNVSVYSAMYVSLYCCVCGICNNVLLPSNPFSNIQYTFIHCFRNRIRNTLFGYAIFEIRVYSSYYDRSIYRVMIAGCVYRQAMYFSYI
jgi:hypothetical protein